MTGLLHEKELSRKTFLKGGGALIVGFSLVGSGLAAKAQADSVVRDLDPSQLDSWLTVGSDGKVTVFTGRVDLGQHKQTSFAQIISDELDVAFDSITLVMGDTSKVINQGASSASDGLLNGSRPLRHAAAQARATLLELASQQLGVPLSQLSVTDGVVSGGGKTATYAELIGGKPFATTMKVLSSGSTIDVQGTVPIKDPSQYKVIGKSIPSVTIPAKVTGKFTYVQNVHVPGMVHARMVLPPSVGAHLISVDGFKQKPQGLIKVVTKGDFIGIVTQQEWQAIEALAFIKTTWDEKQTLPASGNVFEYLRTTKPFNTKVVKSNGDVGSGMAAAAKTFAADYNYPANSHGLIGPPCAVADVRGSQCTVFSATQDPYGTQSAVADILGVPAGNVRVIYTEGSGQYGRGGVDDAATGAAILSQQIGKPVRLQWMRQQETAWEPNYPPSAFSFRAGVDSSGLITALDYQEYTWGNYSLELPLQLVAQSDVPANTAVSFFREPGGGDVGTYAFQNYRHIGNSVPELLRGTAMRSPGRIQMNFAGEQFFDEIASATGQDPIQFRIRHLGDNIDPSTLQSIKPRALAVLQTAQQVSGWETRPSPGPGARSNDRMVTGRGISLVASQRSAYIANVAEVTVDRKTGKVRVDKMDVVVDAGQIVNPTAIKAQIEGATIYAASRAVKEQLRFDRSKVTSVDWVTYPILRFADVPEAVNITLIDRPTLAAGNGSSSQTDKPTAVNSMGNYVNSGIGEPPNTVPPAAIGNAIFDATGVRMRQAPFTPARVLAALKAAGVA